MVVNFNFGGKFLKIPQLNDTQVTLIESRDSSAPRFSR